MNHQTWQPIETAPRDGTPILVWGGHNCSIVTWDAAAAYWRLHGNGQELHDYLGDSEWNYADAAYWCPLPDPPDGGHNP